jgi:hypothetical protein
MICLIERFRKHLEVKEDALRSFCHRGVQVEGWFKGEMIAFLHKEGIHFDREVKFGSDKKDRKKIDFQVTLASQVTHIEMKHWLIGNQRGRSYNANWYFSQGRDAKGKALSNGIQADFEKLSTIGGERYILIATTAKPSLHDWQNGVHIFNERALNHNSLSRIKSVTDLGEYPDHFFLGLLHLEPADEPLPPQRELQFS